MGRSAPATFASVVAIAALALIGKPSAADCPRLSSKPVRIIVPYTPGSPNDVMVRLLAQQLQGRLGPGCRHRQQARRRHDDWLQGGRGRAARWLHAAVRKLGSRGRADLEQADRIRSAEGFHARCVHRAQLLPPRHQRTRCLPIRSRNSSPMPGPILASSVSVSRRGRCLSSLGEYFNRLHGLDITSVPYRGGALVIPTCWAAASMSTGRRPRRCCRSFGRAGSRRWPRRARNAIPICPTCPP